MKERLDEMERRLALLEQAAAAQEAAENAARDTTLHEMHGPQRWAA